MKLDKMKEDIADKLPHELKTPLVPILGYAEMIETETDINSAREMARLIVNSEDLLKNKIDKFLALKDLILLEKINRNYLLEVNL